MISTNVPDRGSALLPVRGVIERLVRGGSAVARSDSTLHSIFPVAVYAAEGDALREWVLREEATKTIEIGLGYGISALHVCEGLLVNAGVWQYTRWSLTTPVIREESVGPLAATRRSNQLVRGRFWFVFMTATVAYYLEGVVIHESALVAGSVTGSHTWGAWTGGSIAATLVVPLAAFATSLAHSSVASRALPLA